MARNMVLGSRSDAISSHATASGRHHIRYQITFLVVDTAKDSWVLALNTRYMPTMSCFFVVVYKWAYSHQSCTRPAGE
jgi:hypothetical protein